MTQDELTKLQEQEALRKVEEWRKNEEWLAKMRLEKQKADERFYAEQGSNSNGRNSSQDM